jgi:hypothetical protein
MENESGIARSAAHLTPLFIVPRANRSHLSRRNSPIRFPPSLLPLAPRPDRFHYARHPPRSPHEPLAHAPSHSCEE